MSYSIVYGETFKRNLKHLEKRYRQVRDDIRLAIQVLQERPRDGRVIPGGSGVRKLRVRNRDLKKGKRSGYRLLYYVEDVPRPVIYLLMLYSKSEKEDVTCNELKRLLNELAGMAGIEGV